MSRLAPPVHPSYICVMLRVALSVPTFLSSRGLAYPVSTALCSGWASAFTSHLICFSLCFWLHQLQVIFVVYLRSCFEFQSLRMSALGKSYIHQLVQLLPVAGERTEAWGGEAEDTDCVLLLCASVVLSTWSADRCLLSETSLVTAGKDADTISVPTWLKV